MFPRLESFRGEIPSGADASGVRCPSVGVTGAEAGFRFTVGSRFERSSELPEKRRRIPAAGLLSVRLRGGIVDNAAAVLSARCIADVDCERGEGFGSRPFWREVLPLPWTCDYVRVARECPRRHQRLKINHANGSIT